MAFCWLLLGLLLAYGLIIGTGGRVLGSVARNLALAIVLLAALRIRHLHRGRAVVVASVMVTAVIVTTAAATFAGGTLLAVLTAASTMVMVAVTVSLVVRYLVIDARVDIASVLGVLCIYLLIALFFSSLHEIGGALQQGYLQGSGQPPTAGDCLYLSVITITTVGFGDITPGSNLARMVSVLEALVGQLYLVSIVAAVIGSWRPRARRAAGRGRHPPDLDEDGGSGPPGDPWPPGGARPPGDLGSPGDAGAGRPEGA